MNVLKGIYALLTPAERRGAIVLLLLMGIGMVLETFSVGLVIPFVSVLMRNDAPARLAPVLGHVPALARLTGPQLVVAGMVGLVIVYLIKAVYLGALAWRQMKFAFGVQATLSQRLFRTYLHQPYTFHLQRNSAQLIRNATSEVTLFSSVLLDAMALGTEGLVLAGVGVLLLVVEPIGAAVVAVLLGASAWGFHATTRKRVTRWGEARQRHEGMRLQHLQQGLGGVKEVKLLGREKHFLDEYWLHNAACARVLQRQQTLLQLPRLWMEVLGVTGLAALVLSMLARGHDTASIMPTLALFAAAAFRMTPSANRVLAVINSLRYGLPVVSVLRSELALPVMETPVRGTHRTVFQREIELHDVTFSYADTPVPALRGVRVRIGKNETVGFIGPSGSGKTTLVDVLLGLVRPERGEVRVDGVDVAGDLRAWQDQIGYVSQTIYLTDDTLRRNVAFGVPEADIDDQAVARAVRAAQLEDFAASLPAGLETIVGERGARLSGGQRQRIGIARALYHDPAVLVLDEATSALDTATERGVMDAIAALQGSRTIVIVAHRLSTVERCDRLYRLEAGRIVEAGLAADVLRREIGTA
jgi:ATP-binding cassette, subfamily B, bacterial PglK